MPHALVTQLRYARSQLQRCLAGVQAQDAMHRLGTMNSLSWIIGHLASQENFYWVRLAQGRRLAPDLHRQVGSGQPGSAPPLEDMWAVWHEITTAADDFLDGLTATQLEGHTSWKGEPWAESIGSLLLRNIYHYWFHIGEAHAIRQSLGHTDLPQFVGELGEAVYRPE